MPAEWSKKILYATMSVGITLLMGSDAPVDRYQKPQGFSVSLQTTTPEEAERAFNALSKSGSVRMPMQETFFATRFGMLVDQLGIPWMINCRTGGVRRKHHVLSSIYNNIKTKTGKTPEDFKKFAEKKGLLKPGVKAMEIVAWLKKEHGLGHGHAMAIYATFKGKKE